MTWTAYNGKTRGEKEPVSFVSLGEFPTKRLAYAALQRSLGGKKSVSGILRTGHSFFAIPAKRT